MVLKRREEILEYLKSLVMANDKHNQWFKRLDQKEHEVMASQQNLFQEMKSLQSREAKVIEQCENAMGMGVGNGDGDGDGAARSAGTTDVSQCFMMAMADIKSLRGNLIRRKFELEEKTRNIEKERAMVLQEDRVLEIRFHTNVDEGKALDDLIDEMRERMDYVKSVQLGERFIVNEADDDDERTTIKASRNREITTTRRRRNHDNTRENRDEERRNQNKTRQHRRRRRFEKWFRL